MESPKPTMGAIGHAITMARLLNESYDHPTITLGNVQIGHHKTGAGNYLVVCGSNDTLDWIQNFRFRPEPFGEFQFGVSRGLQEAISLAYLAVRMNKHKFYWDKPWFVAGHSHGAGVAENLAGLLHRDGCDIQAIDTFGGQMWTRDTITISPYRFTHHWISNGDKIPYLPPHNKRWERRGQPQFKRTGITYTMGEPQDRHIIDFFDYYDEHAITNYIVELTELREELYGS